MQQSIRKRSFTLVDGDESDDEKLEEVKKKIKENPKEGESEEKL